MSKLRIEREFAAPPQKVFDFVTRPENLMQWWGPEDCSLPQAQLDFTRPGPWMSVMHGKTSGNSYKVSGVVLKVEKPHSVELTWAWHDENDARGHESRVRFDIRAKGTGSVFTLVHSGLATEESVQRHNLGWISSIRKLENIAT